MVQTYGFLHNSVGYVCARAREYTHVWYECLCVCMHECVHTCVYVCVCLNVQVQG